MQRLSREPVDRLDPPGGAGSVGQPLRSRPAHGSARPLLFSDGQVQREDLGEQVLFGVEAVPVQNGTVERLSHGGTCLRAATVLDGCATRQPNPVERAVAWLKQHCAIASGYDKLAAATPTTVD